MNARVLHLPIIIEKKSFLEWTKRNGNFVHAKFQIECKFILFDEKREKKCDRIIPRKLFANWNV
jgi:hypothetical protein